MNMGSGIPCTLERVGGKRVSPLPDIENRKEFVHRKFEDRMKEFGKGIKERQEKALKLIAKKTLSKKDQEDLNFHIQLLTQEIERNIPYFSKCFQENVDEVVQEAKLEIENAIQHKVTTLGMEALHEKNQLLSDGGGEKGAE